MTSATGTESAPHDAASDALWQQDTQALHAGYRGREQQRSAAVPIYQSTSFVFDSAQHGANLFGLVEEGDVYSRTANPTLAVLEQRIAALEGGVAALALAFAVVWVYRFIQARMGKRGFPLMDALRLGSLSASALVLNFAWPFIAAIVTGRPDAYVATELAWRAGYPFDGGGLAPILPWFSSAEYFIGGFAGQLLVVAALVGSVAVFFIPQVRALGLEFGAISASYFVYLLLFFFPQSSILRILMPTFVLFGALAQVWVRWPKPMRYLGLVILVVLQFAWLMTCWRYSAPDFSPP